MKYSFSYFEPICVPCTVLTVASCLSPLLIATGEAIPLRGLEGVPCLPGAPQEEAGLTRKFETPEIPVALGEEH